jgi:acyl carrier protein
MDRKQIQNWSASADENQPTWRDGLRGSDRTYMILAVPHVSRNGYRAIVYGRYNGSGGKIKFYPNPETLGIDRRMLQANGFTDVLDRPTEPYTRCYATLEQVKLLLGSLDLGEWAVCPLDMIHDALVQQKGRATSRARHPVDSGFEPTASLPDPEAGGSLAQLASTVQSVADKKAEEPVVDAAEASQAKVVEYVAHIISPYLIEDDGLADLSKITAEATLESLGLVSLDVVELITQAEDDLGIEIPEKDVEGFKTVGEFTTYLGKNPMYVKQIEGYTIPASV